MADRLTPVDILNLRFPRAMGGYARSAVDSFVQRAASDLEAVLTECAVLRDQVASRDRELAQLRSMESTMREVLVVAQKSAEETRAAAKAQAEAEVRSAEAQARDILSKARDTLSELNRQVDGLRSERSRLARDLRGRLASFSQWLDEEMERQDSAA